MKKRAMDVILSKRQSSIIDSINPETEALWKSAKAHQQWLQGDPIKTPDGDLVDFSMFDFIVATATFNKKDMSSTLTMLQKFWATLYPYIDNLIAHQVYYQKQFEELYGIEGSTLKKYALQNLELQCRTQYMNEAAVKAAQGLKFHMLGEFEAFHSKFKAESDAEIVKIKAKEDEWIARQEKMAEEKKKEADREAFASTLA